MLWYRKGEYPSYLYCHVPTRYSDIAYISGKIGGIFNKKPTAILGELYEGKTHICGHHSTLMWLIKGIRILPVFIYLDFNQSLFLDPVFQPQAKKDKNGMFHQVFGCLVCGFVPIWSFGWPRITTLSRAWRWRQVGDSSGFLRLVEFI